MWYYEHSIKTTLSKTKIWQAYQDVGNWPKWDHDLAKCDWSGEFKIGETYRLTPQKGPKVKTHLIDVQQDKSFTNQTNLPLAKLIFHHDISEHNNGLTITHSVKITGILGFLFVRILGKDIAAGLPRTMEQLVEYAGSEV